MQRFDSFLQLAFWVLAVLNVWGEFSDSPQLIWFTKPLLMPLLWIWLFVANPAPPAALRRWVLFSLVFATIGDVLLMLSRSADGTLFFMAGLGSFLLAHICYILGFTSVPAQRRFSAAVLVPFALYLVGFLYRLWPNLPAPLRIAVPLYGLAISTMAITVVRLYKTLPDRLFWPMLAGALLFVLSDSMIAINKFAAPIPQAGVWIMTTYIVGQYLLVWAVRNINKTA